jgi:hypothetical protein
MPGLGVDALSQEVGIAAVEIAAPFSGKEDVRLASFGETGQCAALQRRSNSPAPLNFT